MLTKRVLLVEPDRLRFDFSHFGQVQADELEKIEEYSKRKNLGKY